MLEKNKLQEEMENAIKWIRNYVQNSGAKGIVIGNSGGKDSATVLAMAVKAIGKENVISVFMPCHSVNSDLEDAKIVSSTFDVKLLNIDLTNTYNQITDEITRKLNTELSKESTINMKPRLRMVTLYSIAQTLNYLVIGTGNLCEAMVGYTTKWGDNSSDFNPIGNFTVDEVLEIGKMLGVPERVLKKAPNDGLGGQTDEEKMGITYKQISEVIETGSTDNENAKNEIIKRFKASNHKRNLVPIYQFERKNYLKDKH